MMQLVERHIIKQGHSLFSTIDTASYASKNLYNLGNYTIRQAFFKNGQVMRYPRLNQLLKDTDAYCSLPRKVSQQVLILLCQNWKSFREASKAYRKNPESFLGKPRVPGYKHKTKGRNILVYTSQAISQRALKKGLVAPSGLGIECPTQQRAINQVRIVPKMNHYVIEVIYTREVTLKKLNPEKVAGLDIGLNNLATVTSNHPGWTPLVINGRPLKAINAYYNKQRAYLQSCLSTTQKTSRQIQSLTLHRNCKVDNYLHHTSRYLIDTLVSFGIGTLVIGKNSHWKQEIHLGKVTNQNFVSIPFERFIGMLRYKAELVGIEVIETEESYTSKCSFLDEESLVKQEVYQGKRVKRGLFQASNGRLLNADANGSGNIIRKVFPNAFADGIQGVVVRPLRVTPYKLAV